MRPTERVLDLFAVPGDTEPVPGGHGHSVRAGDLVLSPGRDGMALAAVNPVLARLAADLDTRPGRDPRDLRIAMPIPARNGEWVVEGWGATRFEPGARQLTDLAAIRAVGAVLHAELHRVATPVTLTHGADRWAEAERVAFAESPLDVDALGPGGRNLLLALGTHRTDTWLGPDQLVHGDLAGNVLLDPGGAPVVIDLSPYWRPALWAEAVAVLDSVLRLEADPDVMEGWITGAAGQAMTRAALFRLLSDALPEVTAHEHALAPLLSAIRT